MQNVRENLHNIIDSIEDNALLEAVYEILDNRKFQKDGHIWESLTDEEKDQVLKASDQIGDYQTQTNHEDMMKRNKKWLDK